MDRPPARPGDVALSYHSGLRTERWSYARVRETAFQFARELEARGVGKGDRVIFWADNRPEWVVAFFGCSLRGAVVVPLDEHSTPQFVRRVQDQVAAKLMLYGEGVGRQSLADIEAMPLAELSAAVAHHSNAPYTVENIEEEDLVEIIFTSGTTAEPKGVCLTHRNLVANLAPLEREIQKYIRWEKPFHPIRFLELVPLSHVFGQFMGMFVPQLLGGEVFFQRAMNPSEIIAATKRERISVIVAVPRQLEVLRDAIERDYASRGRLEAFHKAMEAAGSAHFLKRWWIFRRVHRRFGWKFWAFVSGGATIDADTEEFWRRLGYVVVQGYGMTETASLISVNHPFKMGRRSIGKTLPGQQVKLDESGEILVRGENISPGYWSGELKRLTNDEGWLRTGDLGEMDEAGNLYFKGRKKDVIVAASGMNIYPDDLEAALNSQPEVRASCVFGTEGPQGPEPVAALILNDEDADAERAVRRANETLAQHQHIRRWFVWPDQDFPRTPTQKVRKQAVADRITARNSATAPKKESGGGGLAEIITAISGEGARVDPSATLAMDLKLDSLGRVELLSALEERYQVEIDEAAFTAATTVGEIEKIIREGPRDVASGYPYPRWAQRFPMTWVRLVCLYLVVLPIARLMSRARVKGRERLGGLRGPALFISNHISMVDHGLILLALPGRYRRRLAIAMEGERLRGWRHPPAGTGWFTRLRLRIQYALVVTLFNVFPLPQKSGFRRSFAYAGEAVDRGYSVLVFPEGRTTEDGQMQPFMGGTGLLASDLRLPVVPVRIDGLFELKRQKRYFARSGEVSVTIGGPVGFGHGEEPAQITRELESQISNLRS
jgi:long-chain acyl-CoA synthetase